MPDAESTVYPDAQHDEDNETEISEYLTLAQLGSILRELAVKGRIYLTCFPCSLSFLLQLIPPIRFILLDLKGAL